jgi:regulator of cell morphogenesis and NO signaling
MENIQEASLKSIALENFELIPILEKYSLDFCCRGKTTLKQACIEKEVSLESILAELNQASSSKKTQMPFTEMTAEQLISYILIHHHFYVKNSIPTILNHIEKVNSKHGEKYPHMEKVLALFNAVADELLQHMQKEEGILFPRIKLIFGTDGNAMAARKMNGYIDGPISMMEIEHEKAGDLLFEIRELTQQYLAPDTACTTHRICLDELKAFELDLHQHVHLENNILFPMAKQKMLVEAVELNP